MQLLSKILKIILLIFLVFIILIFCITYFYGDKICNNIIKQLSKNFNTEITFKSTNLLLFKYFPNAAISFHNININSSNNFSFKNIDTINAKNLLYAEKVSLKLNIYDLIFNKILIINGIEILNGELHILKNEEKIINTNIISDNKNKIKTYRIHNITLHNCNLILIDENEKIYIKSFIEDLNLIGNIQLNDFKIASKISVNHLFISLGKIKYQFNWNKYFNIKFLLSSHNNIFEIKKGKINIFNDNIDFIGILDVKKSINYNINGTIKKFQLSDLLNLPIKLNKSLRIFNGIARIKFSILGSMGSQVFSNFSTFAEIYNLDFRYYNYKIEKLNSNLSIVIDNSKTCYFKLKTSNINGYIFNNKFNISNLSYDFIDNMFALSGNILVNLANIKNKNISDIVKLNNGTANIIFYLKDTLNINNFNGLYYRFLKNIKCSIIKTKCIVKKGNYSIDNLNIEACVKGDTFKIVNLYGNVNGNILIFSGYIPHFFIYSNDSINHNIIIEGLINGKYLNLDNLLLFNINNVNNISSNLYSLNLNVKLKIDSIKYKNIKLLYLSSNFYFKNRVLYFNNLNSLFCDGNINNSSLLINYVSDTVLINLNSNLKNIDIKKLFLSFNDFGQNELSSNNIKGIFNGKVNFNLYLNKGKLIKDKLIGEAEFEISKGELIGFKPIYKLSKFINISELNDIKFNKINNKITLVNSILTIPPMNINSTALNLKLFGTHSLENEYEYHFKILFSDVLYKNSKNIAKENIEYVQVEEDTLKQANIYIKLKGNSKNYKISYDTKQALKTFTTKIESEKSRLKKIFYEEFVFFKNDSSIHNTNTSQNSNLFLNNKRMSEIDSDITIYKEKQLHKSSETKPGNKSKAKFIIESEDLNNKQELKPVKKKPNNKIEWRDE